MKFKKVRDLLIRQNLIKQKEVLTADRSSMKDMLLVHTQDYLDSLRNPMKVGEILHLDYVNPWDEYIFEYFRFVTGGTILATKYAFEHNSTIFNLGGGFHHAHSDKGEGFCLLNDVAIAIEKLRLENGQKKILLIDLDYHQGNGNLLYFKDDDDIFTFSVHAVDWVKGCRKTNNLDIELPSHTEDSKYLQTLSDNLPEVFDSFLPDLVIYVAGSDPYIRDTLGDFNISETGMLQRDIFVYQQVRRRDLPLVVVGAGGYGPESYKIYFNFIKWVVSKGNLK